jgi:CheY-like chemotaxis protein
VLDVMMKVVNGLEALRQLRAVDHLGAYIPVHLVTGYRDPRLVAAAEKMGISGHSIKPVSEQELWAALQAEMLPQLSVDEIRILVTNLRVQDPKAFEDVQDRRFDRSQYRLYPALWRDTPVVVAVRHPLLPRQILELADSQIVDALRVYRVGKRGSQLIWPTLYAEKQLAAAV